MAGWLSRIGRKVVAEVARRSGDFPAASAPVMKASPPSPPPSASSPPGPGQAPPLCEPGDLNRIRAAMLPRGLPVVVNHWATWCEPCTAELPLLVEMANTLKGRGRVLGISWDLFDSDGDVARTTRLVEDFARKAGLPYPTILFTGTPEELFAGLSLDSEFVPQTIVLDLGGEVLWRHLGELITPAHRRDLEEAVDRGFVGSRA